MNETRTSASSCGGDPRQDLDMDITPVGKQLNDSAKFPDVISKRSNVNPENYQSITTSQNEDVVRVIPVQPKQATDRGYLLISLFTMLFMAILTYCCFSLENECHLELQTFLISQFKIIAFSGVVIGLLNCFDLSAGFGGKVLYVTGMTGVGMNLFIIAIKKACEYIRIDGTQDLPCAGMYHCCVLGLGYVFGTILYYIWEKLVEFHKTLTTESPFKNESKQKNPFKNESKQKMD